MSRRLLVALALVLLLALLLWIRARNPTDALVPATASLPASATSIEPEHAALERDADSETAREPAAPQPARAHRLELHGLVHVEDREKVHRESARGFLVWTIRAPDGSSGTKTSAIEHDHWSLAVDSNATIEPTQLVWSDDSDSRPARIEPEVLRAVEADGHTVRAHFEDGFVLRVLDSRTHEELRGVHLVLSGPRSEAWRETVYPPACFLEQGTKLEGDSPLVLPNLVGTRIGWVCAAGHAWRRFAFQGAKGELTVALHGGADVEVRVLGRPSAPPNPQLQLFALESGDARAAREPWAEVPLGPSGRVTLLGLPPGAALFVVQPWPNAELAGSRLGEVHTDLVAGMRTELVIDLGAEDSRRTLGTLDVRVLGARECASNMARLQLASAGDARGQPQERYLDRKVLEPDGSWSTRFERLEAGHYFVSFLPRSASRAVDVPAGGTARVELDLRMLAEVRVEVRGRESRRSLAGNATLLFRPPGVGGAGDWEQLESPGPEGDYAFRCVPGPLTIAADAPGHETRSIEVEIPPQGARFVLELERKRLLSIPLRAVQGDSDVSLPEAFWSSIQVRALGGAGRFVELELGTKQVASLIALDCTTAKLWVNAPGRYRIEFASALGIAAPPPLELDLGADGVPEQRIAVEYD